MSRVYFDLILTVWSMPWARGTASGYRVKRPKTGAFGSFSLPPGVHLSSDVFWPGTDLFDQSLQSTSFESVSRSKYATLVYKVLSSPRIVS